ncbi:VOC family protein [Nocardiopsis sp. CNT-189]|uniref:VOC family protein n=1 Tax=Nocardiopsis oceanisediminis TaxID=2816862 RepID=UPI003B2A5452
MSARTAGGAAGGEPSEPIGAAMICVSWDCPDPRAGAAFYRELTGWDVLASEDTHAVLGDGPRMITLVRKDDYRPPSWPEEGPVPMRFHLDFAVQDVDAAVERLLALGATRPGHQRAGHGITVLLDPAGQPFCIGPAQPR